MNRERVKSALVATYEPGRAILLWSGVLLAVIVVGLLVWYLPPVMKGYAHAAEAQAQQIEANTIAADLNQGVKDLLVKVNAGADQFVDASRAFKEAAQELGPQLQSITNNANQGFGELTGLVADMRRDSLPILNGTIGSVKAVVDDAKPHVVGATKQLESGMTSLADAARVLDESIKDPKVKAFVDDAMARTQSILVNLDTATGNVTLATADAKQVTTHLIGVSANFEAMTKDSRDKLHSVLYPPPVKGFWPRTGRILSFIYKPALEGAGIYYRLQSLPVRITQPIPLFK